MATKTEEKSATLVTTGLVRLSYANLWKPSSINGSAEKYSCALLIPKSDKITLGKIEAALTHLKAEATKKYGVKGKLPSTFALPLHDGDEEKPGDDAYADCYYLNAKATNQPGIVGMERDADGKLKRITDESEVYSGCYARASINFYIYDVPTGKGIAVGLNNIQKVKDGEPLAGRSNADDDFEEDYEDDMLD